MDKIFPWISSRDQHDLVDSPLTSLFVILCTNSTLITSNQQQCWSEANQDIDIEFILINVYNLLSLDQKLRSQIFLPGITYTLMPLFLRGYNLNTINGVAAAIGGARSYWSFILYGFGLRFYWDHARSFICNLLMSQKKTVSQSWRIFPFLRFSLPFLCFDPICFSLIFYISYNPD